MKNRHFLSFERLILYSYFLGLIFLGTLLLALPASWGGEKEELKFIDAFFIAVSAVCVTGLVSVDTSSWSSLGQIVILVLIQAGGLGIVTFSVLYVILPRMRVSLRNSKLIRESFTPTLEVNPKTIIRSILTTTLLMEGIGAAILAWGFARTGSSRPIVNGIFHAVSAFSNAGFSRFDDSFVSYRDNVLVNVTLMVLIVAGGLGFIVIRDIRRKIFDFRRPLLLQTRLMLLALPLLILGGGLVYFIFESSAAFADMPLGQGILAALFQSVTTRTAGFNTVDQASFSTASRFLTILFMLIGGGSGSTAGGLKVSTVCVLLLVLFKGLNNRREIHVLHRRLVAQDIHRALLFFMRAMLILGLSVFALIILEPPELTGFSFMELFFESVSALGTVGLSLGITAQLSVMGKIVLAATMFSGRVGLFSLAISVWQDRTERLIEYSRGEVLIG